jgi:DNA repair protein SbcD/Mre11
MRLVHLSDLHLGYRQYQRLTPSGINQREADVALASKRAIDATIGLKPEFVVFAGDIFHTVRPTNPAILHAFEQFARLRAALPQSTIVMVAGNHDTPRAAETGCILRLFAPLGIHVVDSTARRLAFPEHGVSILAVPDVLGDRPALTPDPDARYNVLLLHGEVEGMVPAAAAAADRSAMEVTKEDLGVERWSYVALGHFHVFRSIAPNAFYSGSLDYTSANPWGELIEERATGVSGKGFIEYDLITRRHRFHPIAPPRLLLDLPVLSARGLTASDVDAQIAGAVDRCDGGIEGKIVRLVVRDIPRHIVRELDHRLLREYRRRALHFQLDVRRPEVIRLHSQGASGRRPSLADIVRDKLQGRLLEADIDRSALVDLGLRYLAEAEAVSVAAVASDAGEGEA